MATAEERLKILKMIDEGKISAEEGARLLSALAGSQKTGNRAPVRSSAGAARWLRVRVTDTFTGKTKATVNLPIGLAISDASATLARPLATIEASGPDQVERVAASVAGLIAEEDQADNPSHGLPVDGHAEVAAPGFAVVQDRADEAAHAG